MTITELFQYSMVIIGVITLVYTITKDRYDKK